jgi:hypothetical protein
MIKMLKFGRIYCLYRQEELFKDEKCCYTTSFCGDVNQYVKDEEKNEKQFTRKETKFPIELNEHIDAKNFFR